MIEIKSIDQMKKITDGYFLHTKLKNPDHIHKDDVIHKFDCNTLDLVKTLLIIPKNSKYYHIKSDDEEILNKYGQHKTCLCIK